MSLVKNVDKVLRALRKKSLTALEIIELGNLNPYGVIHYLRKKGYKIETRAVKGFPSKKFFLKK